MKRLLKLLAMLLLVSSSQLQAQSCDPEKATWSTAGDQATFLGLITGNSAQYSVATWSHQADVLPQEPVMPKVVSLLYAQRAAEAAQLLVTRTDALRADSSQLSAEALSQLEAAGIAAIVQGRFAQADTLLMASLRGESSGLECRLRVMQQIARYFQTYGASMPLFPHFNSGFFNYLQDNLGWTAGAPDAAEYVAALNTVALLYRLDLAHQPLYMEMLGDLLSKETSTFNANYMACLAYMRASLHLEGKAAEIYRRKALFALEAPRSNEERFNQYRFTQLTKALQEDVDSASLRQIANAQSEAALLAQGKDPMARLTGTAGPITAAFEPTDLGRLPAMLAKSKAQIEARQEEYKRYAGDVDLKKEVKKDNRFNAFALFLIGVILLAVIYIWRRLRKGN